MATTGHLCESAELLSAAAGLRHYLQRLEAAALAERRPAVTWLRRAAAVVAWPDWAGALRPGTADEIDTAKLAQASGFLAGKCRQVQPDWRWGLLVKRRREELLLLLAELADHLDRVHAWLDSCGPIAPPARGLRAGVETCLAAWRDSGQPAAALASLAARLPAGLLPRLLDDPALDDKLAARAQQIVGQATTALATEQAEALALACLLAEHGAAAAVEEWLAGFGLSGRLSSTPAAIETGPGRLRLGNGVVLEWGLKSGPGSDGWGALPLPPAWALPGQPELAAPPLQALWHEARQAAAEPAGLDRHRTDFAAWLVQPTGRVWFHRCLTEAVAEPASAARAWWTRLRAAGWCRAYPDFDAVAGRVFWPADVAAPWPTVESVFDAAPPGTLLAVGCYSPDVAGSRCRLSDGPRQPGSPLDRFAAVVEALQIAGLQSCLAEGRYERGRALALASPPRSDDAAILALDWLDALAQLGIAPPSEDGKDRLAALDRSLTALRAWGETFGLTVLPRHWSFRGGGQRDKLAPDEATMQLFYRTNDPSGSIFRVRQFGLMAGAQRRREALVSISVGPAPTGLAEMEELLRAPELPGAEPIRQRLRGWRQASLEGYLPTVALQFFEDYYGVLGDDLRAASPDVASRLGEALARLLEQHLQLRVFVPAFVQEYPEAWLQLLPGQRVITGRVRAVHRPGLKDAQENLRIPALVEVE